MFSSESEGTEIFGVMIYSNYCSEVYKYYTLSQSLIKLDLMINVEFMITMFFVMYAQVDL
jgi:hypothetical protein